MFNTHSIYFQYSTLQRNVNIMFLLLKLITLYCHTVNFTALFLVNSTVLNSVSPISLSHKNLTMIHNTVKFQTTFQNKWSEICSANKSPAKIY